MLGLGDFLGGDQSSPVQTPGANDPGYEDRKRGWTSALKEMVADPVNALTLFTMAQQMQNPKPGQNVGQTATDAIRSGLQYRARFQAMMDQQAKDKTAEDRDAQKLALDERRVAATEQQTQNQGDYYSGQLQLGKDKLALDRQEARDKAAAGGNQGTQASSEKERVASNLMAGDPKLSYADAVAKANMLLNAKDPNVSVAELAKQIINDAIDRQVEWQSSIAGMRGDGTPPEVPTVQQARQKAREILNLGREDGRVVVRSKEEASALPPGTPFVFVGKDGTEYPGRSE